MSPTGISANRLELLQIADAVAKEKSIDKKIVISAMEEAIQRAAASKYGSENRIKVEIDEETGSIKLMRLLEVVEEVTDNFREISLEEAKTKHPEAEIGGPEITEELPPIDFGRVAAQSAKQVIVQKVRDAERERHYEEFKDRVGEIISGVVKRVEYGSIVVDLGRAEAIIRKDDLLPREIYRPGDRVRAYIFDVRREMRGPQIFLSRTHSDFMANLFAQEVPEIYDGIIEIVGVARDPGSRAKICVSSKDSSIDPVGACVGMRGSRVQSVVNELHGEKIDIVHWSEDPAVLVVSALAPAEIQRVIIDDQNRRIEVILTEENLSKAIGRRGQNVRLASKLINYEIDILTAKEESEKRQLEFKDKTEIFIKNLEVDETLGQLLVAEGFSSIEEIHQSTLEEILKIEAIDENTAKELKERAEEYLKKEKEDIGKKLKELGVEDVLINFKGLTPGMLVTLGEKKIKTLKDFADLSTDELIGGYDEKQGKRFKIEGFLEEFALAKNEADDLIMNARNIVFK